MSEQNDTEHRNFEIAEYEKIQVAEARAAFASVVARAEGQERTIVMKYNRAVAAIVPMADFERLRKLDRETREAMIIQDSPDDEADDLSGAFSRKIHGAGALASDFAGVLAEVIGSNPLIAEFLDNKVKEEAQKLVDSNDDQSLLERRKIR